MTVWENCFHFTDEKWKGTDLVQCHRWSIPLNWDWSPFSGWLSVFFLWCTLKLCLALSLIFLIAFFQPLWKSLPPSYPFSCFFSILYSSSYFPSLFSSLFLLSSPLCLLFLFLRQETKATRGLSMLISRKQWHLQESLGNEGRDSEVRIKRHVESDDMEKALQIKAEGINH